MLLVKKIPSTVFVPKVQIIKPGKKSPPKIKISSPAIPDSKEIS
jgi:hypothetical protein